MKKEKLILFTLAAIQFTNIMDFMIMMPLGPQLMRIFSLTADQFGFVVSSYTYTAGIFGFIGAFFIDRFDRKRILFLVYTGFIGGTLFCAFAPNYLFLLIARISTGIFGGLISALVLSIIADLIPLERRSTAMGVVMAAFSASAVFGVPFGLYMANLFSWHAPFFIIAAFASVFLTLIWKILPNIHHEQESKQSARLVLSRIFTNRNQLRALLLTFSLVMGQFSVIPYISPYVVKNVGITEEQLPLIYLIGGLFTIFSGPFIGRMSDRFQPKRVFLIISIFSILPLLLISNLGPSSLAITLLVTTLFIIFISGRTVPAMTLTSSTVKPQNRGSFMSINSSVQQLSAGLATNFAGMILVTRENGTLGNYNWVGFFAIALSFFAMFLSRRIKMQY